MISSDTPELRAALSAVQHQIDTLDGNAQSAELRTAWSAFVIKLDMGPAPLTRECPYCKQRVMQAATRCGYCWKALAAVDGAHQNDA